MKKQTSVQTSSTTMPANEVLGTAEKTLHFLIIGEDADRVIINVGEKTFTKVNNLNKEKPKK